jgi:hypothetical protein
MGASQRTKGAVYEREVADRFNDVLELPQSTRIKRHIGQARDGGNDLTVGPLVVECKRRKTLTTIETWLGQAEQATKRTDGMIPCVVARQDKGDSLIVMRLDDFLELDGVADGLRADIQAREARAGARIVL